jgi:hypothetical protein
VLIGAVEHEKEAPLEGFSQTLSRGQGNRSDPVACCLCQFVVANRLAAFENAERVPVKKWRNLMEPLAPRASGLGSLAQSARTTHLTQARRVLIGAGILIVVVNGALAFFARDLVLSQLQNEVQRQGVRNPNQAHLREFEDQLVAGQRIISGAMVAMGCLFVVFGFLIRRHPVLITVTSLVIFIGMIAILAAIDPTTLIQGWLLKIIVIVALVKALQAALAAQKDQAAASQIETAPSAD